MRTSWLAEEEVARDEFRGSHFSTKSIVAGMTYVRRDNPDDPVCDSGIFCYGPLLDAIQMSGIFDDSKTFVDKKLRRPFGEIIANFEKQQTEHGILNEEQLREFVNDHFEEEGTELIAVIPNDWNPNPQFLSNLESPRLRGLTKRINFLWKYLSRQIIPDVKKNPKAYSIIYVPNLFVVPGGRFREFYYWDTYWIVKALLHCGMNETVKGMLENFMLMIEKYGCVPNGGRIYYTKRSQPPFLIQMTKEYLAKTGDVDFIRKHIGQLTTEMDFWKRSRSIRIQQKGREHLMYVYGTNGSGPRPESYREDVEIANMSSDSNNLYYNLKAGAETGWDYSSRWMINAEGKNIGGLEEIKTNMIIPVDLNSLMYSNLITLADMLERIGDIDSAKEYKIQAGEMKIAIYDILYDEADKMWFDFDILNKKSRKYFYVSNLFPIWAKCFPDGIEREVIGDQCVTYLEEEGALNYVGGVPTSLISSGQQWDFPNAWPPLQHILVIGLLNTNSTRAKFTAQNIARQYTIGTMFSCPEGSETCHMYEKYNVNEKGGAGHGGEYDVQDGFGWTNGVVIDFIAIFGDDLLVNHSVSDDNSPEKIEQVVTRFNEQAGKSHPL